MKIYLILNLILAVSAQKIIWNGDWAFNCDFKNNDISQVLSKGEDCSSNCEKTPNCTHYSWTLKNNGTCYMKRGNVSKSDAFYTSEYMVCGIIGLAPGNMTF